MTRALGHNYGRHFSTLQEFDLFRIDYTEDDSVTTGMQQQQMVYGMLFMIKMLSF